MKYKGKISDPKDLITKEYADSINTSLTSAISGKQDKLTSGTNIKTINGTSLLGSGNITTPNTTYSNATTSASGLMSASDKTKLDGISEGANKTTVTDNLTSTSTTNALSANQGRVLKGLVDAKQATLGFTPVRQGGGTGMGNNIVYLGWNTTGTDLLVQVDNTQIGAVATKSYVDTQIGNAINDSY